MRMRAAKIGLALFAAVALVGQVSAAVASGVDQPNLVTATPSTHTPNINDGTVFAITQVGSQIIVGGSFTNVDPPGDTNSADAVTRNYILSFDQNTGVVSTTFVPALDGDVRALKPGPTPNTVYVGGEFNNVNGVKAKGVALLSTTTGLMVSGFKPAPMDGVVWAMDLSGGHLIIGGTFTVLNASGARRHRRAEPDHRRGRPVHHDAGLRPPQLQRPAGQPTPASASTRWTSARTARSWS